VREKKDSFCLSMMATEAEDASRPGKDETQSQEEPKAQNGSEEKFLPMFNYKKAIDRDRVLLSK